MARSFQTDRKAGYHQREAAFKDNVFRCECLRGSPKCCAACFTFQITPRTWGTHTSFEGSHPVPSPVKIRKCPPFHDLFPWILLKPTSQPKPWFPPRSGCGHFEQRLRQACAAAVKDHQLRPGEIKLRFQALGPSRPVPRIGRRGRRFAGARES